ncbi:hypothetical protein MAA_03413 [Metarhizium robertsii ARSEF 23]|uniref:Uncharacterized protein n=1 Tax=Metarhizium robertsii (strain ARSEF 23 / ATCC MYA-3075) TaxID=655844 RepID=E9ETR4_METRA|nr:uncharacterized protein MAA_03413 [Metarhizium robertsii ARSEF 23]EFZ00817.1 hypothetical protein MAA_03413 [Metarhizium robertsii ARSEF 23]
MKPNNEHDATFAEGLEKLVAKSLGAVLFLKAYDEHNAPAVYFLDGYFCGLLAKNGMDDHLSVARTAESVHVMYATEVYKCCNTALLDSISWLKVLKRRADGAVEEEELEEGELEDWEGLELRAIRKDLIQGFLHRLHNDSDELLSNIFYEFAHGIPHQISTLKRTQEQEQEQEQKDSETTCTAPQTSFHSGTNPIQTPGHPIDLQGEPDVVGMLFDEIRKLRPNDDPSRPRLAALIANPA